VGGGVVSALAVPQQQAAVQQLQTHPTPAQLPMQPSQPPIPRHAPTAFGSDTTFRRSTSDGFLRKVAVNWGAPLASPSSRQHPITRSSTCCILCCCHTHARAPAARSQLRCVTEGGGGARGC
jgi:hypothetical protein